MSLTQPEQVEVTPATVNPPGNVSAAAGGALVLRERAEPPPVLSTTPTVAGLLQAARRRWRLALFLGLIAASGASCAVWFSQTERFVARTLVNIVDTSILGGSGQGRNDQRTQIAYVRSRLVLNAALRDPKVSGLETIKTKHDPLVWLEQAIGADFSVAPEILRIHMTGEQPNDLTALVNAVRESYLNEVRRLEVDSKQQRLTKLSEIFDEMDRKLQEKRRTLKQMAEDLGSTRDAKIQERRQEMYWKTLDTLQSELLLTHNKLRHAQMDLALQQSKDPKSGEIAIPPGLIEEAIEKDPELLQRLRELARLEQSLEHMKKNFVAPEKEQRFQDALAAQQRIKKEVDEIRGQLRKELQTNVRSQIGDAKASREYDVLLLTKQAEWLDKEVNERLKSFQELSKQRLNVEWLQDEIKLEDELTKKVALQRQLLQVEMQAPDRYRVMEDAFCVPDTDTRIKKAGMAGGGAFAFVVLGIAFLEFRSRRVSSVDEVVRGLRMRLVGALPNLPARAKHYGSSKRKSDVRWQSQMSESIESARTMLLHAAESSALRVISVTSAVGGEGKTLTCSHLAASLARAGRKTLLIDADLRKPSLQKLFSVAEQPGLAELLRGEADLASVTQATPVAGLSLITAGSADDRAVQSLSQPVLAKIFKDARALYDFVIVDTAPVLPVADSQMICQHSDGVVFAILRDVSRLPQIYAAHERLAALRIRILGAIINGTSGPSYGTSYEYTRRNHAGATTA